MIVVRGHLPTWAADARVCGCSDRFCVWLEVGKRLSALQAHRYLWLSSGLASRCIDEWKEGKERRRGEGMWRRDGGMDGWKEGTEKAESLGEGVGPSKVRGRFMR